MKRLLAAIDTTPDAKPVIEVAGKLAQLAGAEVDVLYVMSDEEASAMLEKHMHVGEKHPFAWMQPEEKAAREAEEASTSLNAMGVKHTAYGMTGDEAQAILHFSKEHNVDMIVIGFHGLHGLQKIRALGSVSRAVMEDADCPVVVVPTFKD